MTPACRPPRGRGLRAAAGKKGRFRLVATEPAEETINRLSGDARRQYERHENELRFRGCRAAGYRLLGRDGDYSEYCCLHLYATWRLISTFESDLVVIVAVGRHDDERFYNGLSQDLDMKPVGQRREQKPSCCSDDGWPALGPAS